MSSPARSAAPALCQCTVPSMHATAWLGGSVRAQQHRLRRHPAPARLLHSASHAARRILQPLTPAISRATGHAHAVVCRQPTANRTQSAAMAEEKKLVVNVASCNVKKLDLKAYGVTKQRSFVVIRVGDKEEKTTVGIGLDPTWEETFEFPVADESSTKCFVKFMMGAEGEEKQIGDECEYLLNVLVVAKPTYKGLIVPGGKVDMMFTARGFGKEDVPVDDSALMDLLDGGDGGMMMDSDDEE